MFAKIVADRYARALLQSCPDIATIDKLDDELILFGETWISSPETRTFFLNPKIPPKIKIQIIDKSLGDKFDPILIRLLNILIEKNRQDIIPDISQRFNNLTDKIRGVEQATIVVAAKMAPDIEERLIKSIQRFSTRDIDVHMEIDPKIIGGVLVRLGDKVIDGTLLRRFEEIRRAMLAARVPRIVHDKE